MKSNFFKEYFYFVTYALSDPSYGKNKIHFQKVILFLILYKNYSESSDNAEMYKK